MEYLVDICCGSGVRRCNQADGARSGYSPHPNDPAIGDR
jgi:hypothetical protein